MIVKILGKSATFKGVVYNTTKVQKNKGELMKVSGFGALQALDHLRPQDYINYLQTLSSANTRIRFPQFHAVISCKDKQYSKEELTDLAEEWLKGMGYGDNPYLLIYHRDTANNHIHMVSTRVGRDGKKISDSYEKLRAYQVLHQVLGKDESREAAADLDQALRYDVSTPAQFMMILEARGYSLTLSQDQYQICKYGKELLSCPISAVNQRMDERKKDVQRIIQLRAIIEKYQGKYNHEIRLKSQKIPGQDGAKQTGFYSPLTDFLNEKFGLQVLFHAKGDQPPYGYTVLDHSQKRVFKGSEIMPLSEFIRFQAGVRSAAEPSPGKDEAESIPSTGPDFQDSRWRSSTNTSVPISDIPGERSNDPLPLNGATEDIGSHFYLPEINLDLSDDIDDEAILGRNRQRKGKARTNTR